MKCQKHTLVSFEPPAKNAKFPIAVAAQATLAIDRPNVDEDDVEFEFCHAKLGLAAVPNITKIPINKSRFDTEK